MVLTLPAHWSGLLSKLHCYSALSPFRDTGGLEAAVPHIVAWRAPVVELVGLAYKAHIGAGRTGAVFAATFQHRRVAVQVAVGMPYLCPLWNIVDQERMQYRQLEHLQGCRCIARILGRLP